jgi:uncharacterized HhH-GPD family protein
LHLHIAQDDDADALISGDPLALLIGMVLDQQVPLEWAFSAPLRLRDRLGGRLDVAEIAAMDPEALASVFAERPALHRFPGSNAKRVHDLCRLIVDRYDGQPASIWTTAATGDELLDRVRGLPGFGEQKARIFVGLLGKQLGVRPPGWEQAAGRFGEPGTHLSVADITDSESLARVRAYKQQLKAESKAAKPAAKAAKPAAPAQ